MYAILNASQPPFDDDVRQAVNCGKDNIVKYILQDSAVAQGPIPSFDWAFDAETKAYPYDPEKARQLIAEVGAEGQSYFYVTEGGSGIDPIPWRQPFKRT